MKKLICCLFNNKKKSGILFLTLVICSLFIHVNASGSGNASGNKLIINKYKVLAAKVSGKKNLPLVYNPDTAYFLDENEKVYMKVNKMPDFPGGLDGLRDFCSKNMHYPEKALTDNKSGIVHVGFIVEKDGTLRKTRVVKSAGIELDEEALRVVKIMPNWEPGKLKGKKVPVYFVLPLSFEISNETKSQYESRKTLRLHENADDTLSMDRRPFTYVDQMPEFPGGTSSMMNFLAENILYPISALERDIQGMVVLRFIVEIDGKISNIQVVRKVGGGCDEEAIRVVEKMPAWIPGRQNGKKVRVYFVLPVKFTIKTNGTRGK